MSKPYFARLLLIAAWAASVALASCMTENMDDCPQVNSVMVVVIAHDDEAAIGRAGTQTIENTYIYVFDENYNYYALFTGGKYTYGERYETLLDLDPGTYHFVVWTNIGQTYGTTQIYGPGDPAAQMVVTFNYPSTGIVDDDIPDLHHGMYTRAEVLAGTDNEFIVVIYPHTYRVNFTVEGLPEGNSDYGFTIEDNNTYYTFGNELIEQADRFSYVRTSRFTAGELGASMNVLHLADGRQPWFTFTQDAAALYDNDLIEMIYEAHSGTGITVDFDTMFEFDLVLNFSAGLDVTVTLKGWDYSGNETEL